MNGNNGPHAEAKGADECVAERHVLGGYSHCCVEIEGGGVKDDAEQGAVDRITSPCTGVKSAEGCAAKRRAPGGNSHYCVEEEGGGADDGSNTVPWTASPVLELER